MTRYEFLKAAGFTGGALFALLSCTSEEDSVVDALTLDANGNPIGSGTGSTETGPDESLIISTEELEALTALYKVDTTSSAYAKLLVRNNYVVLANTYVLALSKAGKFIAATVVCSHENNRRVYYRGETDEWYCPVHGARYSLTGGGLNNYGSNGLKIYNAAFDGKNIVIYA